MLLETQERQLLALIPAAQAGDSQAAGQICSYVFNRWHGRVLRFYSVDPALDRDDIDAAFWEGIWRGVEKIDERGNPLYHLGQRGVWNVMSTVRAARRLRNGVQQDVQVVSLDEQPADRPDDADDMCEVVVQNSAAKQRLVRIVTQAHLHGTAERLMRLMLAGDADPAEKGFVKDAAQRLRVSPQRISQCMAQIEYEARHVEAGFRPIETDA